MKSSVLLPHVKHGSVYHSFFLNVGGIASHKGQASLTFLLFFSKGYCGWLKNLHLFFYKITILSVKAEAQLFKVRMASTHRALVGKCFGACPDMLSFMGSFKGSEITPSVFERQAKGKKATFSPLSLAYLHFLPTLFSLR